MRTLVTLLLATALLAPARSGSADTIFPGSVARPNNKGDQVIFYYDVRDGFTTFLNLRNGAGTELQVQLLFYSGDFSQPFEQTVTLPAVPGSSGGAGTGGVVVVDVGALRTSGLASDAGVAIATAVDTAGHPVVTRALSGNFTIANMATSSAWGSQGLARSAIHPPTAPAGTCAPSPPAVTLGALIDGTTVVLTPLQPGTGDLAAYYNPDTLAPAAEGGNQLIFASFVDVPGATYSAAAEKTTWNITGVRSSGAPLGPTHVDVTGVVVSDLVTAAGKQIAGEGGALTFTAPASSKPLTHFIFFTESLGTFSTGYLLPRK